MAVRAGWLHSLALTASGAVWSWGHGRYGQLGHGDLDQSLPKHIVALKLKEKVVATSAGGGHSLALTASGAVWSWGFGCAGLGHGNRQDQPAAKANRDAEGEGDGGECRCGPSAGAHGDRCGVELGGRRGRPARTRTRRSLDNRHPRLVPREVVLGSLDT